MTPARRVFISYRRGPSTPYARQIYDELTDRLGDRVFYDIDTLQPGTDFLEVIERHIDESGLMLVIMDSTWPTVAHPNGDLRLEEEEDPVRMEVSRALERGLKVVSVLVGGAKKPKAADLPDPLKPLARHQAHKLGDRHWAADIDALVKLVAKNLGVKKVKPPRERRTTMNTRRGFLSGGVLGSFLSNVSRLPEVIAANAATSAAVAGVTVSVAAVGAYQVTRPAEDPVKQPEKSAPVTAEEDVRDLMFDTGGVGNLRIGMTFAEAESATGLKVVPQTSPEPGVCTLLEFDDGGIPILSGTSRDGETIASIMTNQQGNGTTPTTEEGVGFGSTESEIETAYAGEVEANTNPETGAREVAVTGADGVDLLVFSFFATPAAGSGGTVTEMAVGPPEMTDSCF